MRKISELIAVFSVALTLGASAALVWTDDGQWHGTDSDVTNWLDTVTGTYPTLDQISGTMSNFVGGVVITNTGSCNGDLHVGDNALLIDGVGSQMVNGTIIGTATMSVTDASLNKTYATGGIEITLNDSATLLLTGGGNPLAGGATVDLNSATARLQFNSETWAAFESEHIAKVTSFGVALMFGSDPFVEEPGDNAVAKDFNAPNGVQISYSDGTPPPPPLPAHEDFDGTPGESVDGSGSGNGWDGNWVKYGGTAGATTYAAGSGFSDGSVAVPTTGLSALLAGGEDLQRNLGSKIDTAEYPEVWLSFLIDTTDYESIPAGHGFSVLLNSGNNAVLSFGKKLNQSWRLATGSTNLAFTADAGSSNIGNWLGVVKLAFDGNDTVVSGYLAEESDEGLDISDVSTFLRMGSITNSGSMVFDNVRMYSHNTTTAMIDEIRLADNYLDSIGLGGSPSEPIGTIVIAGPVAGGGMTLSWTGTFGQVYNVETNANLIVPYWGVYGDPIVGEGGGITVTTTVDQAEMFYKVTTPAF